MKQNRVEGDDTNPRRGLKARMRAFRVTDGFRKLVIEPATKTPEVTEVVRGRRFCAGTKYVLHPTKGWRRA